MSSKGDRGTGYKFNPWAHMTPYRIQALFRWAVDNPNLEPRPVDSEVLVIVGVTDNSERHEKVSSSGAKVYVHVRILWMLLYVMVLVCWCGCTGVGVLVGYYSNVCVKVRRCVCRCEGADADANVCCTGLQARACAAPAQVRP